MKDNDPTLFVNSISVYRSPDVVKSVKNHRIDDINALLKLNKRIEVEVMSNNKIIQGYIKNITNDKIVITINNCDNVINLLNISSIKIINTQ